MNILVVGDIFLDQYLLGSTDREFYERPSVGRVFDIDREVLAPGGAANVAANICSMGSQCSLVGASGMDRDGSELKRIIRDFGINDQSVTVPGRTTVKTRYVVGSDLRFRADRDRFLDEVNQSIVCDVLGKLLKRGCYDIVIVSDYGKGAVSKKAIDLIAASRVPYLVDPVSKNSPAFYASGNSTPMVFKLNAREARTMSGHGEIAGAVRWIYEHIKPSAVVVTDGSNGAWLTNGVSPRLFNQHGVSGSKADPIGAGDCFIAGMAVSLANRNEVEESVRFGNAAAVASVRKPGTSIVTFIEAQAELR